MPFLRLFFVLFTLVFSSLSNADIGTVKFKVQSLILKENVLLGVPYVSANIYLDGSHPHGGGQIAAETDGNGEAVLSLEAGEHTVIFSQWTSSQSVFVSETYRFEVTANKETLVEESLVTTRATIVAEGDVGWGRAYYVTGATDLLGNWETAYRMTPISANQWSFFAHLPLGIEYKILRGPWLAGMEEIPTTHIDWEIGDNRQVRFVEILSNLIEPQF